MNPRKIDGINLPDGPLWREDVYAYQRKGEFSPTIGKMASEFAGGASVHLANPDIPAERRVIDHVLDACEFKGITDIPPIAIVDTKMINAASIAGKMIVFTTGIMKKLPDDQIRAVAGHEISHHGRATSDLLTMGAIALTSHTLLELSNVNGIGLLEKLTKPASRLGRYTTVALGTLLHTALAMLPLTPYRWHMERNSDREGASFAGAKSMADALASLKHASHEHKPSEHPQTFGRVCLEYLKRGLQFVFFPFTSHPPIDSRIAELREREHSEAVIQNTPLLLLPKIPELSSNGPAGRVYTHATDYQNVLEQQATPALPSHNV